MPTYCYRTLSGQKIERVFPIGAAPKTVHTPFGLASRSFADENKQIGRILSDDDLHARQEYQRFMRSDEFKQKEKSGKYVVVGRDAVENGRAGDAKPKEERLLESTNENLQKLLYDRRD